MVGHSSDLKPSFDCLDLKELVLLGFPWYGRVSGTRRMGTSEAS